MVFGGGAPLFDGQGTTETGEGSRSVPLLRDPLPLVAVGVPIVTVLYTGSYDA